MSFGNAGDDELVSKGRSDVFSVGDGRDLFVTTGLGELRIVDFEAGRDRVDLNLAADEIAALARNGDGRLGRGDAGVTVRDGALTFAYGDDGGSVRFDDVRSLVIEQTFVQGDA